MTNLEAKEKLYMEWQCNKSTKGYSWDLKDGGQIRLILEVDKT